MTQPQKSPEERIITFPEGLPGLEECTRFVLLAPEGIAPLLLLQAVEHEEISLPVVPVELVQASYPLRIGEKDRKLLALAGDPVVGENVLCLTVLILGSADAPPVCNLMAPIVINPEKLVAKQVLQLESDYPSFFPLPNP